MSSTTTYTVQGMTCGHCVSSVSKDIGNLDGVTQVEVDLDTGKVDVTSDGVVDADAVRQAVEEAGYEVES